MYNNKQAPEQAQALELAERIRQQRVNRFLPIVVLDSGDVGEPATASMGMLHLPYPYELSELKTLLDLVFVEWRSREHRSSPRVFIDQAGAARWINEDEILFVEYASRRVVIHLRKEIIEYKYMPLSKFAADLSSQFVQVHQSYVVNFQAVRSYNRQLAVLKLAGSQLQVPVGRSYQKRVAELIKGPQVES